MDGKGRAIDYIFIDRFWRNIKYEKLYLEPSDNGLELYHKLRDYMKYYNLERPHQGLKYKKPVEMYPTFVTDFQKTIIFISICFLILFSFIQIK